MFSNTAIMWTLIAGFSTGLGAIPIYLKKDFSKKSLDTGLGFSAGVMLVASFISLILPGMEIAKKTYPGGLGLSLILLALMIGYLFIIVVHDLVPHEHFYKPSYMNHSKKISRVTLIIFAIALHNIPEGLAVGVGFGGDDDARGIALAIAIALQNMPEGLVVAFGLLSEGASRNKAFFVALLSGLVEPVAAVLGYFTSTFSHYSLPLALSFAGGTMLFVICQEMLPEIFKDGNEKHATLGVIVGVMVMLTIDFYF